MRKFSKKKKIVRCEIFYIETTKKKKKEGAYYQLANW